MSALGTGMAFYVFCILGIDRIPYEEPIVGLVSVRPDFECNHLTVSQMLNKLKLYFKSTESLTCLNQTPFSPTDHMGLYT